MGHKNGKIFELDEVRLFRGAFLVLDKLTLSLAAGQVIYLSGDNGSGKSSLLKLLFGALPLSGGRAEVLGSDLNGLDAEGRASLRRRLAWLSPEWPLVPDLSLEENLMLALEAQGWLPQPAKLRLEQVLEGLELLPLRAQSPESLNRWEAFKGRWARAILNNPELMLLDEPTLGLSTEAAKQAWDLITQYHKQENCSMLIALSGKTPPPQLSGSLYRCAQGQLLALAARP